MRTRRSDSFTTITVAGQVLPADLLQRIADKDKELGGLGADSYHLSPSETISEATSRAWNKLVAAWANFKSAKQKLPANDPGTTVTRERWLLPLFQELGYGRLPASRSAVEIERKAYAISHWWSSVPIHLVGVGVSIDRLSARIAGAARSSPHSLVQELLNRSEESLWGFVSNGVQLRILRDNQNLVRQAYVEFDLETMMEGEAYSDFVMLWLLCHQSRVEADKPTDYWLEKWSRAAQERGVRALEHLREGVGEAISLLGRGFFAHRANTSLKEKLRSGLLNKQDYYRQLLRLVYRLLFLFVAEDRTDEKNRSLLFDPAAPPDVCERYSDFYSTKKLRRLAERRYGSRHSDLYVGLRLVMSKLGGDGGCSELALPALGSFLFSEDAISDLSHCEIANHDLLDAVRALAFTTDDQTRRQIDYKNLGSEELGSVYESLLELHPKINADAAEFSLSTAAGHERKTTGSYYTPDSLVQCLLDSALDPVLNERERNYSKLGYQSAEDAILDLKICDPACGSGHFLIAAAHRTAYRLASVRTGDAEPSPDAVRLALRDVVGRCIYGVDINPMSVELCKVSLWMETIEPGKPLSFLDHHILCGNSLLGATPALMKGGIPDDAFKPIEGDDRALCSEYKKQNKRERQQETLRGFGGEPWEQLGDFVSGMMNIETISDDTIEGVRARQKRYEALVNSNDYRYGGLHADAWCAAFVWKKRRTAELPYPITEEQIRRIRKSPFNVERWMEREIRRLAAQYQFFHWHLAFPGVFRVPVAGEESENKLYGWSGGFDCILANPPWERVKLQEKEWFAERRSDITNAPNAAARKRLIEALATENPKLLEQWNEALRQSEGENQLLRSTGMYPLCGRGDINLYAVFAESMRDHLSSRGRVGCILQSGIATSDTTKFFFQDILLSRSLVSFFDFDNRDKIFPAVQGNMRFCLLTLSRTKTERFEVAAQLLDPALLGDSSRRYQLCEEDVRRINPNTLSCPTFTSAKDAVLVATLHRLVSALVVEGDVHGNPWGLTFATMLHMANDSGYFQTLEQLSAIPHSFKGNAVNAGVDTLVPLYEAKLAHQFNHRASTFEGVPIEKRFGTHPGTNPLRKDQLLDAEKLPLPRYWVPMSTIADYFKDRHWQCAFRDAISATADSRSLVATVLPFSAVGHTLNLFHSVSPVASAMCLLTAFNSFVPDYVLRQKATGAHASFYIVKQLPFPSPQVFTQAAGWAPELLQEWLLPRVMELTYTAWDLESFAQDCGYYGPPYRWDESRRFLLRCELDAAFFHLYLPATEDGDWKLARKAEGAVYDATPEQLDELIEYFPTPRDAVSYIIDTFRIVKRKDEEKFGEYRTKRIILEIYDEMAQAIASGQPYQTRLNPPPADPAVAHSPRVQPLPLVLPSTTRYPQPEHGVYMMRVILSMLQESGGSIDVERLMNACSLLAMPDTLETYGARIEPDLAHEWRTRFSDQFRPDLFLPKLDDLVQRGEIRLVREDASFKATRVSTADLVTDLDIEFDARFALRTGDSLGQVEREAFAPMATREEIESRSSEAA